MTVNISIGIGAAAGTRSVSVVNAGPGGGTATLPNAFTVANPVPTVSSVTPNRAGRGSGVNFTITGTNFLPGESSVSFGTEITLNSFAVVSQTQITGNI